ncbi:MAG: YraN family protein [Phycisphaerales bacterium]
MIALARFWSRLSRAWAGGVPGGDADRLRGGRAGERAAARFLRRAGYRVLARNVRSRLGEADLVCLDPDGRTIVIVEVRSRRLSADPAVRAAELPAEASVRAAKTDQVRRVAAAVQRSNGWLDRPMRLDLVAVEWAGDAPEPEIRHHVNAM